jgi:hypothetical protein
VARATYHNFLRAETLSLRQTIDNFIDNELYIETSKWWILLGRTIKWREQVAARVPLVDSLALKLQLAMMLQQMFEGVP